MQAFMTPTETRIAYAKWEVRVSFYPGWETRGRPASTGPHKDARGIVIHHTGSDKGQTPEYNHFLFVDGRASEGIPGPLCNETTEMDGDVIIGAVGRANHAGSGSSKTLEIVSAGKAPGTYELKPGPDNIDGNAYYYGNEVKYDGGQPMTTLARKSALLAAAARCDHHNWGAGHVIGHKEHTLRKGDPGHELMNKFRTDLAILLAAGPSGADPGTPGTPPKDTTITFFCIDRLLSGLGVSGECLIDNYQIMNIAVYFYGVMATTTRPAFWNAINTGDWARAAELQTYALKIIQSNAKIEQTGKLDTNTAKFLRSRGYTVL